MVWREFQLSCFRVQSHLQSSTRRFASLTLAPFRKLVGVNPRVSDKYNSRKLVRTKTPMVSSECAMRVDPLWEISSLRWYSIVCGALVPVGSLPLQTGGSYVGLAKPFCFLTGTELLVSLVRGIIYSQLRGARFRASLLALAKLCLLRDVRHSPYLC